MGTAYFDCFSGISGNMILGAWIDLGVEPDQLISELKKLNVSDYEITTRKVTKNGIKGTYVDVEVSDDIHHRHLKDIYDIIDDSDLSERVQTGAKQIFLKIAEAESCVHHKRVDEIHFHEVGATDAVIDVVGALIGLELLDITRIVCSRLPLGCGFIQSAHGKIPLPSPATAEIIKGLPVYSSGVNNELVTPTGAAIASSIADSFGEFPCMTVKKIGYGAGTYDMEHPNLLRVFVGDEIDQGVLMG